MTAIRDAERMEEEEEEKGGGRREAEELDEDRRREEDCGESVSIRARDRRFSRNRILDYKTFHPFHGHGNKSETFPNEQNFCPRGVETARGGENEDSLRENEEKNGAINSPEFPTLSFEPRYYIPPYQFFSILLSFHSLFPFHFLPPFFSFSSPLFLFSPPLSLFLSFLPSFFAGGSRHVSRQFN